MNAPPQDLPPLREVIARHNLAPRKSLGQHFLLDENITGKIVRLCGDLTGVHVFEIGPGPGGLTRPLLASAAAHVTAIELDSRAIAAQHELALAYPGRLSVIEADATRIDLTLLAPAPRQIIANLPYNAGSEMLINWLHQHGAYQAMTLMFQLEVAERLTAAAGDPGYGRLSVLAQAMCETAIIMRLPPEAFVPPPAVHSAVVRFLPRQDAPSARQRAALERVTAAAFGQRRKMLRVSLKPLGGEGLLRGLGIDPQRRAETLSIAELLAIADAIMPANTSASA